jgi:hypothetical protein
VRYVPAVQMARLQCQLHLGRAAVRFDDFDTEFLQERNKDGRKWNGIRHLEHSIKRVPF